MAPASAPGEPRISPKPQPLGNFPLIILFTTCTCCALFLLLRRASNLRTVVAHQLNTWSGNGGGIRLSIDDGPPAHEFIEDDYDDDPERLGDDEPLALRAERLKQTGTVREAETAVGVGDVPPRPPPKN
ncbi:hypothetical protein B0H21DRAFT_747416 [Amylocystis lapponica]|nr:hypothetical protein B0H21DRAFT_747416 [Amylocystis lapponica]